MQEILGGCINSALALLPERMDSNAARIMMLAIGLQESEFLHRKQIGGPARGFWQFERGGGVHGVMRHPSSAPLALTVCSALDVRFDEQVVYNRLAVDDVLAAAFARLLLWTDPRSIPDNADDAWSMYIRNWRPGKPHPEKWPDNYRRATAAVMG